jgi:CRP-like cAMP-binding protein
MMSSAPQSPSENRILAALSVEEYERLEPHLETVSLELSEILFRPEDVIQHAYFLTGAIVSLLTELADGGGLEVGLVGREGMIGISAILGGKETKVATVQAAGAAMRVRVGKLQEEFRRGGKLQGLLLRYTHALMTQISQSVVCNARHDIPVRLTRWLLMYHDRLGADEFELTHEFMATMLGVRRAGVTEAANELQRRGLIEYQRGHITILNRQGLEDFACECYPIIKERFDNFML